MPDIPPPRRAVILYGRASFDRKQNVAHLAASLREEAPDITFAHAYEDLTGPALPDVIGDLVADGLREFLVVPCAIPADPTMTKWLPGALSAWREGQGAEVSVRIAPPIERFLDLGEAARKAIADTRSVDVSRTPPSMGKPGWTEVPEHRRQVFFCLGARCAHREALPLYQHLRKLMRAERRLAAGPERAMCARTGCLFPCNQGPLLIVQPDGVWYGRLDRALIGRIVDEHLLGGRPVEEAIIHQQTLPRPATRV